MIAGTGDGVDDCARLGPRDTAAGRGFTDPGATAPDLAASSRMLAEIQHQVRRGAEGPARARPVVVERREATGRLHRAILFDERRLGDGRELVWVGFFGVKRPDVDSAPLTDMDDALVRALPAGHPDILSYSSLELADGNWGNLILLDGDEAREHWRTSERHAYAARELAPRHYEHVRLHQGVLPGGARPESALVLRRTKYYDYRKGVTWRAEREWPP
jgi:hypothetical protein